MENNEYKYVTIIFENFNYGSTPDNPIFYGKEYLYKTKKDFVENQIIELDTDYGHSRAAINRINIPEDIAKRDALDFGWTLDDLKEI